MLCIRAIQFRHALSCIRLHRNRKRNVPSNANSNLPSTPTEAQTAATVVHGRALLEPTYHPRTHSIPVALLHFRSHHLSLLNLYVHFASHAASALGIPITRPAALPTQRRLWTVIKGPFVHKKAQENFERKTHKRVVKVYDADQDVVDKLLAYLEHHALAGVGLRAVRWHRAPVGVGAQTVESVRKTLRGGMSGGLVEGETSKERVKRLGERIVREETKAAMKGDKGAVVVQKS